MADEQRVATRFGLDRVQTAELLADFEAFGWITWNDFAGSGGWSLTAAGKVRNERQLAEELTAAGATDDVTATYHDFVSSNALLLQACTHWQLRPTGSDRLATNRHDDSAWDATVLADLEAVGQTLADLQPRLVRGLGRFAGYDQRYRRALDRVHAGDLDWVTGVGKDSCHTVWMELHEACWPRSVWSEESRQTWAMLDPSPVESELP